MQILSDLLRRVENLIRQGTIEQTDYASGRVRVRTGELLTDWIPWLTSRAGNDKEWWPPEQGEQVLLLCPSGDTSQGYAIPAAYQQAYPAPSSSGDVHRREYADGTYEEYDRVTHKKTVNITGDVILNVQGNVDAAVGGTVDLVAGGNVSIDAPSIHHNGGAGVVTAECICQFTGNPHSDKSSTVTAGK